MLEKPLNNIGLSNISYIFTYIHGILSKLKLVVSQMTINDYYSNYGVFTNKILPNFILGFILI